MLASDAPELSGEGEGHQKIGDREQPFVLLGEPGLSLTLLAGRAVTVATRVVAVARGGTDRTGGDLAA